MEENQTPHTELEKELVKELEEFKKEKERVKKLLGNLGGSISHRNDMIVNGVFLVVVLTFFILEITTHFLPPFVSLEIGLLSLSIKIIWMMYSSHKVNHFQFWILNSIEYRVNQIDKKLNEMDKKLK